MRIAVAGTIGIPATYGGVERHVEELSTRLVSRGHEVTVFCRSFYTPNKRDYRGVRLVRLPTIRTKHLESLVHTGLASLVALSGRYDVVHYHAMGPGLFTPIPKLRGMRTVVTLHGLDWRREKWGPLAKRVLRVGEEVAVRWADATIVVSKVLQEYVRRKYDREAYYIPNGVNVPGLRSADVLQPFDIVPGRYILFASKLSPEKGAHFLLDAFRDLDTDCKLVIAGGSRHSDAYASLLRAGAGPNVVFLGFVWGEVLEALFSHAYLFVQPSTIEGLAISVLEAMSYGRCVLCSDIPENREAIGDFGCTFANRNIEDLRQKLQFLLSSPRRVRELGALAQERVRLEYNWDKVAENTERIILSLV